MADAALVRCVALLRGVNVGGHNRVPMKPLVDALAARGALDVMSYLQSGNLVLSCAAGHVGRSAELVARTITQTLGLDIKVMVRTHDELLGVIAANPFRAAEADPKFLHVVFLGSPPSVDAVAGIDPDRFLPDRFEVVEDRAYVHYPGGSGRSKLNLDRLGVTATARNWNTVLMLAELTQ